MLRFPGKRVILVKADQSCLIFSELGRINRSTGWLRHVCTLESAGQPRYASACDMDIGSEAGAIGMRTLKAFPTPRICLPP